MSEDWSVREIRGEVSIEWTIKNFCSLPKKVGYKLDSPIFRLSDARWYLCIYPSGIIDYYAGWVSLYLSRKCSSSPKYNVAFTCKILNRDGTDFVSKDLEFEFRMNNGRGWPEFVKISKLHDNKETILEEGSLRVVCTARNTAVAISQGNDTEKTSGGPSYEGVEVLQRNLKELLLSGRESDVTFKVEDQEFQAHRVMLSARSPVFLAMFERDTEEKRTGIVNIEDSSAETFESFLSFLYTGNLEVVSSSNAVGLYKVADKYDFQDLKKACVRCMTTKLSVESFCSVVLLATVHEEVELLKAAEFFFAQNIKMVLPTPDWESFVKEHFTIANELLMKMAEIYCK